MGLFGGWEEDDGREKERAVRQESRKENQKYELTVAASQENGALHQASERRNEALNKAAQSLKQQREASGLAASLSRTAVLMMST